jgi:lysophospholipase L1-like esterase
MSKFVRNLLLSCSLFSVTACGSLVPQTAHGVRAVFIGASIIQYWQNFVDFPSFQWVDKGIAGEKCGDVLARVQTDVVRLHPATVHLLCGTNDIIGGATDPATTKANIMEIVQQARAAKITIILATLPPVRPGLSMMYPADTPDQIIAMNEWIGNYAHDQNLPLADYYSALVGEDGKLVAAYTTDGVHPSSSGYQVMTSVVLQFFQE